MQNNELKAFMAWDGERHPSTAKASPMSNGNFSSWTKQQRWEAWQAKTQIIPEGYVLVPKEPTEDMLWAAWEAPPAGGPSGNRRVFYEKQTVVYKAMVKAAENEAQGKIE